MIYCLDTNVIIDLHVYFSKKVHKTMWKKIVEMVEAEKLVTIWQVILELKRKGDNAYSWANDNLTFYFEDEKDAVLTGELLERFPKNQSMSTSKSSADLLLVSMCSNRNWVLVTQEKPQIERLSKKNIPENNIHKIPNICNRYEIKCINWTNFTEEQKWVF